MKKRKPGRPPKHANGAMTIYKLRVPNDLREWLRSKNADFARDILRCAMDEESAAPNTGNECRERGNETR